MKEKHSWPYVDCCWSWLVDFNSGAISISFQRIEATRTDMCLAIPNNSVTATACMALSYLTPKFLCFSKNWSFVLDRIFLASNSAAVIAGWAHTASAEVDPCCQLWWSENERGRATTLSSVLYVERVVLVILSWGECGQPEVLIEAEEFLHIFFC